MMTFSFLTIALDNLSCADVSLQSRRFAVQDQSIQSKRRRDKLSSAVVNKEKPIISIRMLKCCNLVGLQNFCSPKINEYRLAIRPHALRGGRGRTSAQLASEHHFYCTCAFITVRARGKARPHADGLNHTSVKKTCYAPLLFSVVVRSV